MFSRLLSIEKNRSFYLFGARGTGKSTLLDGVFSDNELITPKIDLLEGKTEKLFFINPDELTNIIEGYLKNLAVHQAASKKWIYIDEIQKNPKLLDIVHKNIKKVNFVLSGSSARKLKKSGANLLAGRATQKFLFPLTYKELSQSFNLLDVLTWGSLPEIYSLDSNDLRQDYLDSYINTYLREEIIQEQLVRNLRPFRLFIDLVGQINGEQINFAKISRQIGVDDQTVKTYFEILEDTLLGFHLWPYQSSIRKRVTKAPKFYLFDLGVKRVLTEKLNREIVVRTEEYGRAFEHFIILEFYRLNSYKKRKLEFFYFRTGAGLEIDLVIVLPDSMRFFIEVKSTDTVNEDHVLGLASLYDDLKLEYGDKFRAICLSNDRNKKLIRQVECIYWRDFFEELFFSSN